MKKLVLGALFAGLVACGSDKKPPDIIVPDAPSNGLECSPLTQNCADGQKCAHVVIQETPFVGGIKCVPDGDVPVGAACMYGSPGESGFSNCVKGSECVAGVCKSICDHMGGEPKCGSDYACSNYNNVFEQFDMTHAGVCDVKCDPLTQEAVIATPTTAACGSTDPAMPNRGCYTRNFTEFTCARIPEAAKGKTDYVDAYGPQSEMPPREGAFVNGCEAGFVPGVRGMSGGTTFVCMGTCAAKKTDSSMANKGFVDGDPTVVAKLYDEAAPAAGNALCTVGKKGSAVESECRFAWFFNIRMDNTVAAGPYWDTLGLCFKPPLYNYNHDMNAETPNRPYPSCAALAPEGMPPANCTCTAAGDCDGTGCPDGLAHQWGCIPLTEATTKAPAKQGPSEAIELPASIIKHRGDFRMGYGPGKAFRHILQ